MLDKKIKVLMIGSDRKLFDVNSPSAKRILSYGKIVDELHIVVFTLSNNLLSKIQLANNVWVYPTNSFCKLKYIFDAHKIAQKIIYDAGFGQSDLVSVQDPFESGLAGRKISIENKLPLQIQIHTDMFSPYFAKNSFLNFLRIKLLAPMVIKYGTNFRVVSEKIASDLNRIYKVKKENIFILPVRVSIDLPYQTIENNHQYTPFNKNILIVSRLTEEKNIFFALEVFSVVAKKLPDSGLVILGDGFLKRVLQQWVYRKGLSNRVSFMGFVNDVKPFYSCVDVFMSTSLFEGFGLAILESALAKLPIVSTPVGIAPELLKGHEDLICDFNNVQKFALKIVELLEDNKKSVQIGEDIYSNAIKFIKTEEEYLSMYQKALTMHLK